MKEKLARTWISENWTLSERLIVIKRISEKEITPRAGLLINRLSSFKAEDLENQRKEIFEAIGIDNPDDGIACFTGEFANLKLWKREY